MKKIFFIATLAALAAVSCKQKEQEAETMPQQHLNDTMPQKDSTDNAAPLENKSKQQELYACPMHPEVQGKSNDVCPKCGMKLTEPVAEK